MTGYVPVQVLFSFSDIGSRFVFGEKYINHPFVFKVRHTPILVIKKESDLRNMHTFVLYGWYIYTPSPRVKTKSEVLLGSAAILEKPKTDLSLNEWGNDQRQTHIHDHQ